MFVLFVCLYKQCEYEQCNVIANVWKCNINIVRSVSVCLVKINKKKNNKLKKIYIFARSLKPDRKCTTATLGIWTAYI